MKFMSESTTPYHSRLATGLAACLCLGLAAPSLAATAASVVMPKSEFRDTHEPADGTAARKCLNDLNQLDTQMQKDGYWLHGYGDRYGYPIYGYSYDERRTSAPNNGMAATSYWRMRPAYEVRTLFASATILAQRGQQHECEALLGVTRDLYKNYTAELHKGDLPTGGRDGWRNQQIATSQPVTSDDTAIRSDQLIGVDVVNTQDVFLGNVQDIVLSPKGGDIAYLLVGRGGVFGIDEKYVPVPWADFRITSRRNLLVLDASKGNMDAAPQVKKNRFSATGDFGGESLKVDDYWKVRTSK